jgi:hypothetical protein
VHDYALVIRCLQQRAQAVQRVQCEQTTNQEHYHGRAGQDNNEN